MLAIGGWRSFRTILLLTKWPQYSWYKKLKFADYARPGTQKPILLIFTVKRVKNGTIWAKSTVIYICELRKMTLIQKQYVGCVQINWIHSTSSMKRYGKPIGQGCNFYNMSLTHDLHFPSDQSNPKIGSQRRLLQKCSGPSLWVNVRQC